ncbi:MAG: hypothetical protein V4726_24675 [Verrucomicrobiota bacterium]
MLSTPPPPSTHLPWWRWINLLALDAVVVALVWLEVFAKMTGARLDFVEFAALAVAVWVIYGADRLLDSRIPPDENACRERHWFTARQARWLVPVALGLLVLMCWWSLHHMRQAVFRGGAQLALGVMVYFGILAASRRRPASMPLLLVVAPVMTGLLLSPVLPGLLLREQGQGNGALWPQAWRAAGAGLLMLTLLMGMRKRLKEPPPWTLFRKVMGGFLFARGVALAPLMHFDNGAESLWQAPVLLFGGACALNSLGIRLWEHCDRNDAESRLLRRLYPWMGLIVAGGAISEAAVADEWTRPVLGAVAGCAAGLLLLNSLRSRLSAPVLLALADAVVLLSGLGALIFLNRL